MVKDFVVGVVFIILFALIGSAMSELDASSHAFMAVGSLLGILMMAGFQA